MLYLSWYGKEQVKRYFNAYPDYKEVKMIGDKPDDGQMVVLLYVDASYGVCECVNCTYHDDGHGYFLRGDGVRVSDCIAWRPCPEEYL